MNKRIEVLDCTLRDGGRCFDNTWGDDTIRGISEGMSQAGIDIVEIGFLWYLSYGICRENSTMFRGISEIKPFLKEKQRYVAYIEYVLFKKENHVIPVNDGTIEGIRLGVLKEEIDEALTLMRDITGKGYHLFVQGINIMSYSEEELISFIQKMNSIKPYAFAIVDTFGAMYINDLKRIFAIVDKYLDKDIAVAFHSHNNMQLSFALAITLIEISGERKLVIDGTLAGIGMGVGNLQTEMLCKYLNEKEGADYGISCLAEMLDSYIYRMKNKFNWDSSLLSYESAIRWTSQLNLSYIKNEYSSLTLEGKRKLLGSLPVGKGVGMHKIDKLYRTVNVDDAADRSASWLQLQQCLGEREILLVGKGGSILSQRELVQNYIDERHPVIIYINHTEPVYQAEEEDSYYWYMDEERCAERKNRYGGSNIITFTTIDKEVEFALNYEDVAWNGNYTSDSVLILLLLLSGRHKKGSVCIAGMDGNMASAVQVRITKQMLGKLLKVMEIKFLTESIYQ